MPENLSIAAPAFDTIQHETGKTTRDALQLIWNTLTFEIGRRRNEGRQNRDKLSPKIKEIPVGDYNNLDMEGCSILNVTGTGGPYSITGFKAPSTGESHIIFVYATGDVNLFMSHMNASSTIENRMFMTNLASIAMVRYETMILIYIDSLWRQVVLV